MPIASQDDAGIDIPGQGTRLDGWKEIASYLGRGERTVKRWEASRGLPTHRIPGDGRRAVFAFSAELDAWLRSSGADEEPEALEAAASGPPAVPEIPDEPSEPSGAPSTSAAGAEVSEIPFRYRRALWWSAVIAAVMLTMLLLGTRVWKRPGRTGSSPAAVAHQPTSVAEQATAHEFYLRGRYEWTQRTPDSLHRAVDSFTQAIVHDPQDAKAYVGLSETYALLPEYSTTPNATAWPRSLAAARKAVELDDSLSEGHRALAFAEMYADWNFAEAEREFRRAIELDPKDPVAHHWYATSLGFPGHFDECLRQINAAQTLDPGSQSILADKGWMLFLSGQHDEGVATLREVERSVPDFESPHTYLTEIGLELRDYPLFLTEGQKLATMRQDSVLTRLFAAARNGYAHGGGERGLLRAMHAAARTMPANSTSAVIFAKVCILMGRKHEALLTLDDLYKHHDEEVLACLAHPLFLTLKGDPQYEELVQQIKHSMHY